MLFVKKRFLSRFLTQEKKRKQVLSNKDASEVRDYGRIADRFAGLLDLSDVRFVNFGNLKKTHHGPRTDIRLDQQRQTDGQTLL